MSLKEALAWWIRTEDPDEEAAIATLQAAARAVVSAPEVWWCEEHDMAYDGKTAEICLAVFYMPLEDAAITAACGPKVRWLRVDPGYRKGRIVSVTIDCGEGKHEVCSGSGDQPYLIPQDAGPRFECGCPCHHGGIGVPCRECEGIGKDS